MPGAKKLGPSPVLLVSVIYVQHAMTEVTAGLGHCSGSFEDPEP